MEIHANKSSQLAQLDLHGMVSHVKPQEELTVPLVQPGTELLVLHLSFTALQDHHGMVTDAQPQLFNAHLEHSGMVLLAIQPELIALQDSLGMDLPVSTMVN